MRNSTILRSNIIPLCIFCIVLNGNAIAQNYDPLTGELIEAKPDTAVTIKDTGIIQEYDPVTGELIISKQDPLSNNSKTPPNLQFDPATGLPINQQSSRNLCTQAKLDGVDNTSPLWYVGGIVYFVGLPMYLFGEPKPPATFTLNMSIEDKMLYKECYGKAAKDERAKRMVMGCGGYLLVFLIFM